MDLKKKYIETNNRDFKYPGTFEFLNAGLIVVVCWVQDRAKDPSPMDGLEDEPKTSPFFTLHAVKNGDEVIGTWKPGCVKKSTEDPEHIGPDTMERKSLYNSAGVCNLSNLFRSRSTV
jgi:hypothetical protein